MWEAEKKFTACGQPNVSRSNQKMIKMFVERIQRIPQRSSYFNTFPRWPSSSIINVPDTYSKSAKHFNKPNKSELLSGPGASFSALVSFHQPNKEYIHIQTLNRLQNYSQVMIPTRRNIETNRSCMVLCSRDDHWIGHTAVSWFTVSGTWKTTTCDTKQKTAGKWR